jgi:hypothetical protein
LTLHRRRTRLHRRRHHAALDPARRIARALAMLRDKKVEVPEKKHDNLPL